MTNMIKRIYILFFNFIVTTNTQIPYTKIDRICQYLQIVNPFEQVFVAGFDQVLCRPWFCDYF